MLHWFGQTPIYITFEIRMYVYPEDSMKIQLVGGFLADAIYSFCFYVQT